jgi:HEAT repeat protein
MRTLMMVSVVGLVFGLFPLTAAAQDKKPDPKAVLAQLLKDIKATDNVDRQLHAAIGLADFGPLAEPAVPALIAALESKQKDPQVNEDLHLNAAIALGKIGKAAVDPLRELLDSKDKEVRFYAIWALGWVGPDAKDAVPGLIKAMADKDDNIRRKAAYSLGHITADADKTLGVLFEAFKDDHEDVRQAASDAVAKFGKDALPGLTVSLKDQNARVRVQAAHAVAEMGTDAKDTAPLLRQLLLGKDESNAHAFAHALAKLGKAGVPALIDAFKDARPQIQQTAANALREVGGDAVPALVDALSDKSAAVRRMSAEILSPLRVSDKMVVTALAYAVKNDTDDNVRIQCAAALQQLGISGKLAAKTLIEALSDSNNQVRIISYWALQNMGENPRDGLMKALASKDDKIKINTAALMLQVNVEANAALPVLVEALKHKDNEIQVQAAHALAQSGREVNRLLPFFKEGLKSKTPRVRLQALNGLAMMNQNAAPAGDDIIAVLTDPDLSVRQQAVHTLQNVPANAESAVAALTALFKEDKSQQLRISIVQIIPRYQARAMPLLLDALKDGDAQVRQHAVWALHNTGGDLSKYHAEISALIKDKDANIRANLIQLLGRTGEKGIVQLGEMLRDKDENVRWQAAQALQQTGKGAIKVLGDLTEALGDKNPNVRWQVAYLMGQLGEDGIKALSKAYAQTKDSQTRIQIVQAMFNSPARGQAMTIIKQAVKDPDRELRRFAIQMLPNLGQTQEVFDTLSESIKDKDVEIRTAAAYGLQNFGQKGLPILEQELGSSKESSIRMAILQGLVNHNSRAKTLVGPLTDCLKDGQPQVRWMAAHTLGNIGADAKDAVPRLEELLNDTDPTVRQHAQLALKRIVPKNK